MSWFKNDPALRVFVLWLEKWKRLCLSALLAAAAESEIVLHMLGEELSTAFFCWRSISQDHICSQTLLAPLQITGVPLPVGLKISVGTQRASLFLGFGCVLKHFFQLRSKIQDQVISMLNRFLSSIDSVLNFYLFWSKWKEYEVDSAWWTGVGWVQTKFCQATVDFLNVSLGQTQAECSCSLTIFRFGSEFQAWL